jgi:plastocyanin
LNSITILTPKNDDGFDIGLGEESKNTEIKLSSQSDSISTKSADYDTMSKSSEINSMLSIPVGAATPGNPSYEPDTITVSKGKVITVSNDDTAPHTVTSRTSPGGADVDQLFDTSILMPAGTADIDTSTIDIGEHPFHCTVHPFMTGTLVITY